MPSLSTVLAAKLSSDEAASAEPVMSPDFTPVDVGCPDHDRPVLAIRRSSVKGAHFEVITARYRLDYRPNSPWRVLDGDAVSDSGSQILGWREAPDWLLPA